MSGIIGKLLSALVIMTLTWTVLELMGGQLSFYEQLFFTALIPYSVAIFARIIEQSEWAIDELQACTALPQERLAAIRTYMSHNSQRELLYSLAGAFFFGSVHIVLIRISAGDTIHDILFDNSLYSSHLGILATWSILTCAISSLINNAVVWGKLGGALEIDLLRPNASCVIGRIAVLSTLSMIGAQVLFVILILDAGWDWVSIFPGLAASFAPTLALFFVPVWPLHKRLVESKAQALDDINRQIRALGNLSELSLSDAGALEKLNQLLLLRREIQLVSAWPFDSSNMFKIILYLLLPPLTWVGAALVENVVGTFVE